MQNKEQIAEIFSALGNKTRLDILDAILRGISNPGAISKYFQSPRATIEKHLRVLSKAKIISKYPGLSPEGQTRIYYHFEERFVPLFRLMKDI
jgi:DNA-binding transcriptional ArsR family regulator